MILFLLQTIVNYNELKSMRMDSLQLEKQGDKRNEGKAIETDKKKRNDT